MYTKLYQNSYVIFILTFIILCLICYFFEIGYNVEVENGRAVKKFSWKYPLAISLIVWVVWHFYLFPPADVKQTTEMDLFENPNDLSPHLELNQCVAKANKLQSQRINMVNWL